MKNPLDVRARVVKASDRGPGAAPGLLVAPEGSPPPRVDVLVWSDTEWTCSRSLSLAELREIRTGRLEGQRLWVDVNGLGDAERIADIGELFGLHRLSVEDAMNLQQHPNVQSYGDELFTVVQVPHLRDGELDFEQVSLWLGPDFLLTMQAEEASALEKIHGRFEARSPRLLQSGADYLYYVALDMLVDAAFPVLEYFDERSGDLEEQLLARAGQTSISDIHDLRRDLMILRRILWNQSRIPDQLVKPGQDLLAGDTLPYLRDVQDHAHRALDMSDHLRDTSTALFDLERSVSGAQMNEVMKLLTIISTVFIPLTFIVGVYGMNFDPDRGRWNMPELEWPYGYPFAWGLMLLSVLGMLWVFRRKGWL